MKNFCRPKDQKPVYTFSTVTKLPNTSRLNQPDSSHQSTSSARQHYLRQSRYLPGKILVSFRNFMFIYSFFVFLLVNYSGAQYIYIYAFSRRFYPKRLTFTGYIYFFFVSLCVPWKLKQQPFALLMQCSTTEPQEHIMKPLSHNTVMKMNDYQCIFKTSSQC